MYPNEQERLRLKASIIIDALKSGIEVYKIGKTLLELVHDNYKPDLQRDLNKIEQRMKNNLEEAEAIYKQLPKVA